VIRAFVIAVRYSFISPLREHKLREKRQSMEYISEDFLG
jgi:hypothetical protein